MTVSVPFPPSTSLGLPATVPGCWISGSPAEGSGAIHRIVDPATGAPVTALTLATARDADAAVRSARAAFPGWSGAAPAGKPQENPRKSTS